MHDVNKPNKKYHKLFAREKTDLFRWLDMSGVKDGNTKLPYLARLWLSWL